jgi:transposase
MLSVGSTTRIFLCREPVDFRKAHDGLCTIVRDSFGDDPFSGDVFTFFNKAHDRIKLLVWDRNGFWLFYKRLERGTFPFDVRGRSARVEISRVQLAMLLEGIDGRSAKPSSHYAPTVDMMQRVTHGSHARSSE